jgi:hypothetical protein
MSATSARTLWDAKRELLQQGDRALIEMLLPHLNACLLKLFVVYLQWETRVESLDQLKLDIAERQRQLSGQAEEVNALLLIDVFRQRLLDKTKSESADASSSAASAAPTMPPPAPPSSASAPIMPPCVAQSSSDVFEAIRRHGGLRRTFALKVAEHSDIGGNVCSPIERLSPTAAADQRQIYLPTHVFTQRQTYRQWS